MDTERQKRVADNESTFRDVNERIEETHERYGAEGPQEFLCECGTTECSERVHLTLAEYEALRANPLRFAIVPGHEIPEVERVVEEHERFTVIEKHGVGGEVARERDPRT